MLAKWLLDTNNLYTYRKKITLYWPHTLMIFLLLASIVNSYHSNLDSPVYEAIDRDNGEWFFLHVIILPPLILYSVVHQLFPAKYDHVNFREYFLEENRKIIFLLLSVSNVFGIYRFCVHHALRKGQSAWDIYISSLGDLWFYMPHLGLILTLIIAFWKNEILLKIYVVTYFLYTLFIYLV